MSVLSSLVLAGALLNGHVVPPVGQFDRGPMLPVASVFELDEPRLVTAPLGVLVAGDGIGNGVHLIDSDGGPYDGGLDLTEMGLIRANQSVIAEIVGEHRETFRRSLADLNRDLSAIMPEPMMAADPRLETVAKLMAVIDETRRAYQLARRGAAEPGGDQAADLEAKSLREELDVLQDQLRAAKSAIVNRIEVHEAAHAQLERLRTWERQRRALEAAAVREVTVWAEGQGFPDGRDLVDDLRRRVWVGLSTLSGEGVDLSRFVQSVQLGRAARDVIDTELPAYEQALYTALAQRELIIERTESALRRAKLEGDWAEVAGIERERLIAALAVRGVNDIWLQRLVELVAEVNPGDSATLQSEGLRASYPRVFEPTRNQERIARAISMKDLTPVAQTQALAAQAQLQEQMAPIYQRMVEAVRAYEPLRMLADFSPDSDEGTLSADVALAGAQLRYWLGEQQRLEEETITTLSQYVFDSDQAEMDRVDREIDPTMEQDREMDEQESESP